MNDDEKREFVLRFQALAAEYQVDSGAGARIGRTAAGDPLLVLTLWYACPDLPPQVEAGLLDDIQRLEDVEGDAC